MSKAVALNEYIYNLLIEKDLNDFTVTEIRDVLLESSTTFQNKVETRKFAYRQLCRLVKKGILVRQGDLRSRQTVYSKSELFKETHFLVKNRENAITPTKKESKLVPSAIDVNQFSTSNFWNDLKKEKFKHEADLAVVLSEVEEFKALIKRFPEQKEIFKDLYLETRDRSAKLLGKVSALTKVIETSKHIGQPC